MIDEINPSPVLLSQSSPSNFVRLFLKIIEVKSTTFLMALKRSLKQTCSKRLYFYAIFFLELFVLEHSSTSQVTFSRFSSSFLSDLS